MTALTCPNCGAPLPRPLEGATALACSYCGATASLAGARAVAAPPGQRAPLDPALAIRVIEAFKTAMAERADPFEALIAAARERLGPFGETDAFARVVLALAREFDAEHRTTIAREPTPLARLVEGYIAAIEGIRQSGSYTIRIPFVAATSAGPVHFERTLTARDVATLVAIDPRAEAKKRRFWPFG